MCRCFRFAILLAVLLVPLSATAQMTLINQDRSLESSSDVFDENTGDTYGWYDFVSALDFDPFVDMLSTDASDFFGYADSEATQESTLGPAMFAISCYAYTDAELFEEGFSAYPYAASLFEVEFSLAEAADWSLDGTVEAQANATVDINLYDEFGTPVYSQFWSNSGLPFLVADGGTLGAGTYTLRVDANSSEDVIEPGFYDASQAAVDLQFTASGGTSPVGDSLARSRYLTAGPNPMQGKTTIAFAGAAGHNVELDVYDVRGRLVRRLLDSGSSQGQVAWDGRNSSGQDVPQGIYFVRMRDGQEYLQRKVTVIR